MAQANFLSEILAPCDFLQAFVLADNSTLELSKIVRVIPKKRLVCAAKWQGKAVFAKIFIGKSAQKYANRDAKGTRILMDAGIKTPSLLYAGSGNFNGENAQVLVLEAINNAQTAEILMQSQEDKTRFGYAKRLVTTIAFHHCENILHTDIHPNNFLLNDTFVYTLDGDGVRQVADLTFTPARQNLAELISKLDVLDQYNWLPSLLATYLEFCPWNLPLTSEKVTELANQHRIKCADDYSKKVMRDCTDVQIKKTPQAFFAISKPLSMTENTLSIENFDQLLAQSETPLKLGNSATVAKINIENQTLVLKRYNIKNAWHQVKRAFQPSRAAISWQNAHRLTLLNIPTAKPVALIETRQFGMLGLNIRGKAYFLAEHLDAPDVAQFFAQTHDKHVRAEAVKNICTLFYKLYLLQISHGDMKATNIKMQGMQPALIDLDSMRQHKRRHLVPHANDIARFMRNWQGDQALYNAFIKGFRVVYADHAPLQKAGFAHT